MKNLIFVGSTFLFSDCSKVMRFLSMQSPDAKIGKLPLFSTLRFVKHMFSFCNYSAVVTSQYFLFKNLIKGYHKSLVFLVYLRYFSYLYAYERASYGYIKSIARHDGRDAADAGNHQSAVCRDCQIEP